MQTTNVLADKYSKGSRFLHWFIALVVVCMLIMGFFLGDLPKNLKPVAYMLHKSWGITIIFLMVLRIIWLAHTGKPKLPATVPTWQHFLSRAIQYSFYVFLFIMPFAGWIMSTAANKAPKFFGLFILSLPGIPHDKQLAKQMFEVHSTVAWIIIVLLVFHISGAIKHHFIDKDNVVRRML